MFSLHGGLRYLVDTYYIVNRKLIGRGRYLPNVEKASKSAAERFPKFKNGLPPNRFPKVENDSKSGERFPNVEKDSKSEPAERL